MELEAIQAVVQMLHIKITPGGVPVLQRNVRIPTPITASPPAAQFCWALFPFSLPVPTSPVLSCFPAGRWISAQHHRPAWHCCPPTGADSSRCRDSSSNPSTECLSFHFSSGSRESWLSRRIINPEQTPGSAGPFQLITADPADLSSNPKPRHSVAVKPPPGKVPQEANLPSCPAVRVLGCQLCQGVLHPSTSSQRC